MNFKDTIKPEDRAPISLWLGDSQVWMKTALEKDRTSGRGSDGGTDHHELNVAHVCAGLAFELVLKALAKSEGGQVVVRHDSDTCYQALSQQSRTRVDRAVKMHTSLDIGDFLQYLDERMCNPDRKYWMVDRQGRQGSVGFVLNIKGLVIPDLAKVHADIVSITGRNTFDDWEKGSQVRVGVGR